MKDIGEKYTCIAWMLSKRKSQSVAYNLKNPDGFQGELSSKTATLGQIISLDPVGPISPKSIGGYLLMWSAYDVGSSYQWAHFSKTKEADLVIQMADLLFFGKALKVVRSDSEEIFSSREVISFLQNKGVKSQFSVPYQHYQNRVERAIQDLVRGVSTLLHFQRFLPAYCWKDAAKHYVKSSRFIPTKRTRPSTPSRLMGAGDLDLSVRFPFVFGDSSVMLMTLREDICLHVIFWFSKSESCVIALSWK